MGSRKWQIGRTQFGPLVGGTARAWWGVVDQMDVIWKAGIQLLATERKNAGKCRAEVVVISPQISSPTQGQGAPPHLPNGKLCSYSEELSSPHFRRRGLRVWWSHLISPSQLHMNLIIQ